MSSASPAKKTKPSTTIYGAHSHNAADIPERALHTSALLPEAASTVRRSPHTDILKAPKPSSVPRESNGTATSRITMNTSDPPRRQKPPRSPWYCSTITLVTTVIATILLAAVARSFLTRQRDPKGCSMSWMRPAFARFPDFDAEHTRLARKYSLYLYREGIIDEDTRVKGVPVLFIPGNAGSYKQVRPLAAQAAVQYHEQIQHMAQGTSDGKAPLDFFTADFNEDFAALHGKTLRDQAEYVNDAISYILALYQNPHRSVREAGLVAPSSVILIGHSMGGIVARTALTLENYQYDSVNTILTLAAPHSRPPISFDEDVLAVYKQINDYWRYSYSQAQDANNPLFDTTLVSIAGGSLDTIVPSDYSAIASLVPPTHGFSVFTSSIPRVWTSMDHLAITWCNQLRKVVVASLYDSIDARDPSQTRSREDRMTAFKKHFLTGLEDIVDDITPTSDQATLLSVDETSGKFLSLGERLHVQINEHEGNPKPRAYLVTIPSKDTAEQDMFRLLSNQEAGPDGTPRHGEVLLCKLLPTSPVPSPEKFITHINLSTSDESTHLECYDTKPDEVLLPYSSPYSVYPFDNYFDKPWNAQQNMAPPLSYLQYDIHALSEFTHIAFVDRILDIPDIPVQAEFTSSAATTINSTADLNSLLFHGLSISIPSKSLLHEINIPAIHSSLTAFRVKLAHEPCPAGTTEQFTPLLRQHVSEPYESKFAVNVHEADINIHGVAPYIPTPLDAKSHPKGLSLQVWADPFCKTTLNITLSIDTFGSLGKLWMRYRTVFAAFPVLIVALVLRKQFKMHDETGVFVSVAEGMDLCIRGSIPVVLVALTVFGLVLCNTTGFGTNVIRLGHAPESFTDFSNNELLLGLQDPIFWYLTPFFGLICVGICVLVNFGLLGLTAGLAALQNRVSRALRRSTSNAGQAGFIVTPLRRRLVVLAVLLLLVSTVIPYQFVYLVLCIIQITTCSRALNLARETQAPEHVTFSNYTHAILLLLIWILPINAPTLLVWTHNLAVHWLTPFTSHHSIPAITPFIVLVQTLSTGTPIPRLGSRNPLRHVTGVLFLLLALYASVYGVSFAFRLHSIANFICAWLVAVHVFASGAGVEGLRAFVRDVDGGRALFRSRGHVKEAVS